MLLKYIGVRKNVKLIINDKEINIPTNCLINVETKDANAYTATGDFEEYIVEEKKSEVDIEPFELEEDNDGC